MSLIGVLIIGSCFVMLRPKPAENAITPGASSSLQVKQQTTDDSPLQTQELVTGTADSSSSTFTATQTGSGVSPQITSNDPIAEPPTNPSAVSPSNPGVGSPTSIPPAEPIAPVTCHCSDSPNASCNYCIKPLPTQPPSGCAPCEQPKDGRHVMCPMYCKLVY